MPRRLAGVHAFVPAGLGRSRSAIEEDVIGGYAIDKRALVVVGIYDTHRLPDVWPERKNSIRAGSSTAIEGRRRSLTIRSAEGPRMCIGAGLAELETICILATMAQKCRLRLVPDQTVQPEALITLRPRGGLRMTVEWR